MFVVGSYADERKMWTTLFSRASLCRCMSAQSQLWLRKLLAYCEWLLCNANYLYSKREKNLCFNILQDSREVIKIHLVKLITYFVVITKC